MNKFIYVHLDNLVSLVDHTIVRMFYAIWETLLYPSAVRAARFTPRHKLPFRQMMALRRYQGPPTSTPGETAKLNLDSLARGRFHIMGKPDTLH